MLVALGFLCATLLGLMIFPAFWRRAVRLTAQRLKEQLPLTEAEIKADKDRLRAEYAIQVHKLETQVERAQLERARQIIEINRRDARISALEQDQSRLNQLVDENQNARRVLEQTVSDRLPKIEARLAEARTALFNRDRDIAELTQNAQRQQLALEEAKSINTQQSSELDRLTNALTVRGARNQQALADPTYEGELALRAEIEALRSKSREQAGLIGRLQAQLAGRAALPAPIMGGEAGAAPGTGSGAGSMGAAEAFAVPDDAARAAGRDLRALRAKLDDQTAEIARLTAELDVLRDAGGADGNSLRDSKIALKARLSAAQSLVESQGDTIKRLRAEVAAANERLALQGAHFMEQMRRLGAGTLPAGGQSRRPVTQGQKLTLSERVAHTRPPLRPVPSQSLTPPPAAAAGAAGDPTPAPSPPPAGADSAPLAATAAQMAAAVVAPEPSDTLAVPTLVPAPPPIAAAGQAAADAVSPAPRALEPAGSDPLAATPPRRNRLVDRISSIGKG
jgi:hypothetical protein